MHTPHWDLFINYFIKPCCSTGYTKVNSCPLPTVSVSNCKVWSYLDVYLNGKHSDLLLRCTLLIGIFINYFIKPWCWHTKVNSSLSALSVNNCEVWSYLDIYLNDSDLLLRCTLLTGIYLKLTSLNLVVQPTTQRSIHAHCLLYLWRTVKIEVIRIIIWMGHTQTSSLGAHSSLLFFIKPCCSTTQRSIHAHCLLLWTTLDDLNGTHSDLFLNTTYKLLY